MKNVWTDSQGTIQRPEPGSSRACLSKPTRRFSLVSATSTASPRTVLRVWFRPHTFHFVDYNPVRGGSVAGIAVRTAPAPEFRSGVPAEAPVLAPMIPGPEGAPCRGSGEH